MPYFSRLTDIITCRISDLLAAAPDPRLALSEILTEMQEGLAACDRNLRTYASSRDRLEQEIAGHQAQAGRWREEAKSHLAASNEDAARLALQRKSELEDLMAGLRPELEAAAGNWNNMQRIRRALEARFAEAQREAERFSSGCGEQFSDFRQPGSAASVESELEKLRQELGR
ncbi:MAG: PspA/IM30 family protein [Planctomycetaceae bacterium]|jgi:phage shock protein A